MKNTDFMNLSLPEGADKIDVEILNNDFKKLESEASKHYIKQQIEVDGTATIIGSIGPYVQLENLTDNILNVSIGDELIVLMKGDNRKIRTISGENYGVVTNGAVRITYYINAQTYADENFYKKEKVDELLSNVEATVEVDAELSETSENPVQNKTITAALANYATTNELNIFKEQTILRKGAITHSNHLNNNISNVFDFEENSIYAITADVTEEDINGLPEYRTIANLTRFAPIKSNKNYNVFMYTTLNNAYIGFVYGASATSVAWHNLKEHEIYKDINVLTRGLGFEQKKIVIVGDSICAGVGGTGYDVSADDSRFICTYNENNYYRNDAGHCWANSLKSYLEANYPNCTVINNGIGGMNTIWMNNIKTLIIPEDTDIVISYVGTNNRASAYTVESTIASLQSFYDYCKSKGIEVIFISPARVLSTREDFDKTSYGINSLIKALCADNNIYCANLFEKMEQYYFEHDVELNTSLLPDYLHPNDEMYNIMFAMIKSLLAI